MVSEAVRDFSASETKGEGAFVYRCKLYDSIGFDGLGQSAFWAVYFDGCRGVPIPFSKSVRKGMSLPDTYSYKTDRFSPRDLKGTTLLGRFDDKAF